MHRQVDRVSQGPFEAAFGEVGIVHTSTEEDIEVVDMGIVTEEESVTALEKGKGTVLIVG